MSSDGFAPKRLQNVYVVAERPAELDRFYQSALGLPLKFSDGERWFQYGVGASGVAVACREEGAPAESGLVMVFEVDDFDAARPRIAEAGGEVLGERDMGAHGAVLSLRDPEGQRRAAFQAGRAVTSPSSLQDLLDREAIRECLYRYCRGIDRVDEAALRSAYWDDATDCHGAWHGSAAGFIEQALRNLRAGGRRVHQIGNIAIELHGGSAAVESSFLALQAAAATPAQETFLCGRYLDRFECRAGEWRIAARTVVYDWIEQRARPELASADAALFGARQPVGGAAPADPLYALLASVRGATAHP